jgi:hypothetical protein
MESEDMGIKFDINEPISFTPNNSQNPSTAKELLIQLYTFSLQLNNELELALREISILRDHEKFLRKVL